MKKLAIFISAFVLLTSFTTINNIWLSDAPHSQLGFTVKHLGIADVSGTFNDFDATITSSKDDFSDAVFQLSAKVNSLDTRVEARDNHLKSADFFDAKKYPEIKFTSSTIKKAGKDTYKLHGNLTMHGVVKPVVLDLQYNGSLVHPQSKKPTAGFKVTGTIKRSDFNIGAGFPAPMISDEVRIHADGEFIKNDNK